MGRTSGNLFAVSTLGSVLAALLTGFVLIPNVGVGRLLQWIGFALVLTAAAGLVADRQRRRPVAAAGLLLIAAALSALGRPDAVSEPDAGLVAVRQSPYAEIRVVDARGRRHLLIDGGVHTIVTPGSWESQFPYVAVAGLTRHFFDAPGRMLLVGLGGGSVVKDFAAQGWKVDAVEIDPTVVEAAYQFFGLEADEGKVHVDGWAEVCVRSPRESRANDRPSSLSLQKTWWVSGDWSERPSEAGPQTGPDFLARDNFKNLTQM